MTITSTDTTTNTDTGVDTSPDPLMLLQGSTVQREDGQELLTGQVVEMFAGLALTTVEDAPDYLNLLIYGESGVGKTRLAGSAFEVPELAPVLYVDIEGGARTLRSCYPKVARVRVTSWADLVNVYSELAHSDHPFKTVVIDSLTEVQKFNMYDIMAALVARKPDADPDIPSLHEWGKNSEQIRRVVRLFRDLPMNTIFTALEKQDKDTKTGAVYRNPSLSGKLSAEVSAFLDVVSYMYVKEVRQGDQMELKRMLLCHKTDNITAKDRTDTLPLLIENPTIGALAGYIRGDLQADTPLVPADANSADNDAADLTVELDTAA